jgi:tight adherence protein B
VKVKSLTTGRASKSLLIFLAVFTLSVAISHTLIIGCTVGVVVLGIEAMAGKKATNKRSWQLFEVVPEIIDHIISGVQSGLSLNESLINLGTRGPILTKGYFDEFRERLHNGEAFESAIGYLEGSFAIPAADQLFEALLFAKNLGGAELLALLRQLGDFTRQDLALRREILAKQSWVKNSAHLSASAPWLLLLLLSVQPATGAAFSTPAGAIVLGAGLSLTFLAYLWMGKLSKLPESKRIFGANYER